MGLAASVVATVRRKPSMLAPVSRTDRDGLDGHFHHMAKLYQVLSKVQGDAGKACEGFRLDPEGLHALHSVRLSSNHAWQCIGSTQRPSHQGNSGDRITRSYQVPELSAGQCLGRVHGDAWGIFSKIHGHACTAISEADTAICAILQAHCVLSEVQVDSGHT